MTTFTSAPTQTVGHPDLAPEPDTDAGRLRSVALGRSVVADLVGGWLVQASDAVATGTSNASGLTDIAVLDDPSPTQLAAVAALTPGGAGPAVWSTRPIPPADGWDREEPLELVHTPAWSTFDPGVRSDDGTPTTGDAHRVDDPAGLARLRVATGSLGLAEPIGLGLLADDRVRAWTADGPGGPALLIAVVVGNLDVASAVAGEATDVAVLLREWRGDRRDLDGVAVVEPAVTDVLGRTPPASASCVHVATRGRRTDPGGRA